MKPNPSTHLPLPQGQPADGPEAFPPRGTDKLKAERVELMLKTVPGWALTEDGSSITCRFAFLSKAQAAHFAKRVCTLAARRHHYPEVRLHQDEVTLRLTTPAAEGLSQADFLFAQQISRRA